MSDPYVPTTPVAMTLDLIADIVANLPWAKLALDADSKATALKRILPADGGFDVKAFQAWDGSSGSYQPPVIMVEAREPRYEQKASSGWNVTHQIDLVEIHRRIKTDSARAAYLRAWDEHGGLQSDLRALPKTTLDVQGVFTLIAPSPFALNAPTALHGAHLSITSISYRKQQP